MWCICLGSSLVTAGPPTSYMLLMSSNEDDCNEGDSLSTQSLKKRRIQRACDICRRKKIRCDGVHMPGNRCSNCISYSLDCTYVEASKKRGPPKGYVESLENRVEKLDKLLRKLVPDPVLFKELHDSIDKERVPFNPSPLVATQQSTFPNAPANISIDTLTSAIRGTTDNVTAPDDGDDDTSVLTDNLKRLALSPSEYRFFGKSSGAVLIQAAMELKQEYTQSGEPVPRASEKPGFSASRTEFWAPHEWELGSNLFVQSPHYTFPDDDLALELIDHYFSNINLYLPLLHRPSFQKNVTEGLHHVDDRFASIYLLVCAIGARYSDDPRVMLDGVDSLHSCGWRWFNQVQMVKKSFLCPPTLYDLQFYCLSVHFLQGSSAPQSCWTMVGFGIRLAQDVGVHRRKVHQHIPTAEDEQWKRGFWVLVCMDRIISAALGRPCAIHDDDFDLELPADCDDEYWDHPDPKQRFKQPENKPSLISAFILFIKLNQILSYCLRTIYAINKSKILFGYVGHNWEQHIVAELDSALNKWVDSVPDHLRWDPTREDANSFNQSASCYALYYHIQILIHRPFIPSPNKPSPLSFPSLAICTNAARSCSHIAEVQRGRTRFPPLHSNMAIFTSGIVLLLSIWGGKRSGLSIDPNKEMTEVHTCMKTLKASEQRWRSMGRLWDILCELATVGDLPLPQASPMSTNKRERDCDTPRSVASSESPQPAIQEDGPRVIAGSRRVNKDLSGSGQSMRAGQSQQHQPNQQQRHPPQPPTSAGTSRQPTQHADRSMTSVPSTPVYTLPVYSDELGRLPLHGHMDFSTQAYLEQANYWYQGVPDNRGIQSSPHSDRIVPPNSVSHHSNRRQQQQVPDHHLVQSSHNTSNYSNDATDASTITQGFSLGPTIGPGNMMFDPVPLAYIPPTSYSDAGVSPSSIDIGPSQNPIRGGGGRPLHSSFGGISMALRGDRGGGSSSSSSILDQGQESSQLPSHLEQPHHQHHQHQTQGPREHDVHHHHHLHHEQQQQQPMGYSYLDKEAMSMWPTAPTGFELDEWSAYLSNMSELTQGANGGGGGQVHVQQQ